MSKHIAVLMIASIFFLLFTACGAAENVQEDGQKLDFTVVEDADLPEELRTVIEDKKETAFKLTYSCNGYLYIVQGYGEQKTGGYSITVDRLNEAENVLYFETTLMGPQKDEEVSSAVTYPYIVVKVEDKDKSVVFVS